MTDKEIRGISLFAGLPRRPLSKRPVSRGIYECSRACRVYQLDLTDPIVAKIPRGGIVYYTFQGDQLYLCFGRDRWSRDLTDFGGARRLNETPIECAVREGNEESRFAFGNLTPQDVQLFWCLYNSQMLIIFVHVATANGENIFDVTQRNFESAKMLPTKYIKVKGGTIVISRCCDEVSEMVWLDEKMIEEILSDCSSTKVYARVRRFIRSCSQFRRSSKSIRDWLMNMTPSQASVC